MVRPEATSVLCVVAHATVPVCKQRALSTAPPRWNCIGKGGGGGGLRFADPLLCSLDCELIESKDQLRPLCPSSYHVPGGVARMPHGTQAMHGTDRVSRHWRTACATLSGAGRAL